MYRLLVETLLGAHLEGNQLRLAPRFRADWTSYKIHYRYHQTVYHITLSRSGEGAEASTLDGQPVTGHVISLVNDQVEHFAEMRFR